MGGLVVLLLFFLGVALGFLVWGALIIIEKINPQLAHRIAKGFLDVLGL